ncbi:hypothetical protein RND81_08G158000 [Saponaria officinalis]|uniref:Glycosyltransferase n=1 Tax=Saponaria officinalis TaxID=3572 RepID=A0AAW1J8Y3_SAPOF
MHPKKPHVVCIPCPAQGHINPMTKLAKLLHSKGVHITFIHTEFNFTRLSTAKAVQQTDGFNFDTIPDGLPPDNKREANDLPALCRSIAGESDEPKKGLRSVFAKLMSDNPPMSCVILDAQVNFAFEIVKEFDVQVLLFHTASASAVLSYLYFDDLVNRGLLPLSNKTHLTDEFLDTPVDWIPGLIRGAKLKHLPSFLKTGSDEMMFNFNVFSAKAAVDAGKIMLHTVDDLEDEVIQAIKVKIPNILTIGPLTLLCQQANVQEFGSNLWKEDSNCLEWLDKRSSKSVIYINYGSLTTLTSEQLEEFAWGLVNSQQNFIWVIREDLVVNGEFGILSKEYMEEIKDRGLILKWCAQENVLKHSSVAVFLTHCGWKSILESVIEGVPVICWPFFADQTVNCCYACNEWGIGMEIGEGEVKRERVEEVVRVMMEGEKGKQIREKAMELKSKAEKATMPGGSSCNNFEYLVKGLME